jgi:hypothetical protein
MFGRTFVNDVEVKDSAWDLNVGENFTFEVNYARRIRDISMSLLEFPDKVLSPWASVGPGFAHFDPNAMLLYYGVNPNKTAKTVAALQLGLGLDVKLTRQLSLHTAWRDFYSGTPHLSLDTGTRRNSYFGVGGVFHF